MVVAAVVVGRLVVGVPGGAPLGLGEGVPCLGHPAPASLAAAAVEVEARGEELGLCCHVLSIRRGSDRNAAAADTMGACPSFPAWPP